MSPRSSFNYTQLGIGVCGHVVLTWPQITEIGGRNPEVVCEECTRMKYELDPGDEVMVWVRLKPDAAKPKPATPKVVKKPKPLSPFKTLLQEEGLF